MFSWRTAAHTFSAVPASAPETVVLLGISHRASIARSAVSSHGAWDTPLGAVPVDRELAAAVLAEAADLLEWDDTPHGPRENSIEVLLPFVRFLLPEAAILPIAVRTDPDAVRLGEAMGSVLFRWPKPVFVVGSTDLTHYGRDYFGFAPRGVGEKAHDWAKNVNDRSFLDRVLRMDATGALEDARRNQSACGYASAAATVAACRVLGAERGHLLEHVTSHEVSGSGSPSNFVGYASVLFTRAS
jgi:AmmeMemoRadiSam system protein B